MTGQLLASGPEADVYALDERRTLRCHRRDADVTGEADATRHLAGLGRPVPVGHRTAGRDPAPETSARSDDGPGRGDRRAEAAAHFPLGTAAERVRACAP